MLSKHISLGYGPSWVERDMKISSDKCSVCGKKLKLKERIMYNDITMCKKHATEAYNKDVSVLKEQKNNLFVSL